jgi:hypothetical protein
MDLESMLDCWQLTAPHFILQDHVQIHFSKSLARTFLVCYFRPKNADDAQHQGPPPAGSDYSPFMQDCDADAGEALNFGQHSG